MSTNVADKEKKSMPFGVIHTRTERFCKKDAGWFYTTREGVDIGPYADKMEAQMALVYFVERTQWPSETQLRSYLHTQ